MSKNANTIQGVRKIIELKNVSTPHYEMKMEI